LSKHFNNLTDLIQPYTSRLIIESSTDLDLICNTNISDSVTSNEIECKKFVAPDKILNDTIIRFLSCLYANPIIPRNTIQIVVDGIETVFLEGIAVCSESYVDQMVSEGQISVENVCIFNNIIKIIKDSLMNFQTKHKHFNNFATQGTFVEPEEKVIGQRLNSIKKNGLTTLEPCNCTEQFIPLRSVLQKFFSLENILIETLDYMNNLKNDSGILTNFIQGTYWRSRINNHNG